MIRKKPRFSFTAYAPVPRRTVYQVMLRLSALTYMPQYEDLNNTATLKVTNELVLTVQNVSVLGTV